LNRCEADTVRGPVTGVLNKISINNPFEFFAFQRNPTLNKTYNECFGIYYSNVPLPLSCL